ncbi:MAG: OmpA family protein [Pseudomonadota bacterium]|nr:OmpA family protein [Pseudomonadota bacterium]
MGTVFRLAASQFGKIHYCMIIIAVMMFSSACHHTYRDVEVKPMCPVYPDYNVVLCPLPLACTPISRCQIISYLRKRGVAVIRVGEDMQIVLPSDSLFISNSSNFNWEYLDTLKAVSILLTCYDKIDVRIAGYTDCGGDHCRNIVLSLDQAKKVAKYMWEHCTDSRMIYTKGFGECYPIANNSNYFGRARNRRIEITFRDYPHWD